MKYRVGEKRGFTLIELLVVIAIIGLLSSVVLAALSQARLAARDGAIQAEVKEFVKLLELEHLKTGSYTALQPSGPTATGGTGSSWLQASECATIFDNSSFSAQAEELCSSILTKTTTFYAGVNAGSSVNRYSLMAGLPGDQVYFCVGSSGATSASEPYGHTTWGPTPGCYTNP